jgi:flagellar protein FlbD
MIQLTRLNKHTIGVNSDLIKFIENAPDTMITLLTGEKLLVRESFDEILDRIVAFRRRVLAGLDLSDYVANAQGPEMARLPGIKKDTAAHIINSPEENSSEETKPEPPEGAE